MKECESKVKKKFSWAIVAPCALAVVRRNGRKNLQLRG